MIFQGKDIYDGLSKEITVSDGYIKSIKIIDTNFENFLSHSFIDMQVNGYLGVDYSGDDLSEEGILTLIDNLAKTGTMRHVPTIITNSEERIEKNLKIISKLVESNDKAKTAIAGIHIEGPFISKKDGPRGAHDPLFVRNPNIEEVKNWQNAANGLIKIITIAPEKENAKAFTEAIVKMGINVAIGHCEPSEEELNDVIKAGACLSTHLGNGSSAMLPRLKNHIWMQVADDRLSSGIICDGFHLPSYVVKTIYKTKGIDNLILVSDVALLGGLKPGSGVAGGYRSSLYECRAACERLTNKKIVEACKESCKKMGTYGY